MRDQASNILVTFCLKAFNIFVKVCFKAFNIFVALIPEASNISVKVCFKASNIFVALITKAFVAAVAQQCIEEGVNLKVWVETRVYFKILS
jgi:hypothetical protein